MNKDKLISICHKVSSETGLTFNSVLTYFFLENILKQLSESNYNEHIINEHIIFKGGFVLSNIVGIESRSTVDIDISANSMFADRESITNMLQNIFEETEVGIIKYEIYDIEEIKQADNDVGFRVRITCKFENIRQIVPLDIATGDVITYQPVNYEYKTIFFKDNLNIKAYNLETMLAEKIETIYSKGFLNSRSKDFYDIHLLYRFKRSEIDFKKLKMACQRTFKHRGTLLDFDLIKDLLKALVKDKGFTGRWKTYANKNSYVCGTSFEDVLESILLTIDNIEWMNITNDEKNVSFIIEIQSLLLLKKFIKIRQIETMQSKY